MVVTTLLRQADIFYELDPEQLDQIVAICEEKVYQAGELVFEENSLGDELYVIISGEVEIQIKPGLIGDGQTSGAQTIATLRRGQSFGEVALVDEGMRTASARCAQHDTRLIAVPRDRLMLLCEANPALGYRMMRNLAADLAMKIRNIDLQVREQLTRGSDLSSS